MPPIVNKISEQAFSILEVIIVVILIGVLASLAMPVYSIVIERGRAAEAIQALGQIRRAQIIYKDQYGTYVGPMEQVLMILYQTILN